MYKEETKHKIQKVCRDVSIEPETALLIFEQVYDEDFKYSWGKEKAAVGCVAVAIRSEGLPYEIGDIGEIFGIGEEQVFKVYKDIKQKAPVEESLPSPLKFVDRIHNERRLGTDRTVELAKDILKHGEEECQSRSPMVMAASAYYLALRLLNQEGTQEEVAGDDVTIQSIRARYKDLSEVVDEEQLAI